MQLPTHFVRGVFSFMKLLSCLLLTLGGRAWARCLAEIVWILDQTCPFG